MMASRPAHLPAAVLPSRNNTMPSRSPFPTSHLPLMACLLLAAGPMTSLPAAVTLVQDGKPRATIVVTRAALTAEAEPKPEEYTDKLPAVRKIAAAARD